jgi:hypothetical protein
VFIRHVAAATGILFRFDLKGLGGCQNCLYAVVAEFFQVDKRGTAVGRVLLVGGYREFIGIDKCVPYFMQENETRRIEHHLVSFIVVVPAAAKIIKEIFHQLVAYGDRIVGRIVESVHLPAVFRPQVNIVRQYQCLVKSVSRAFQKLFTLYLPIDLGVTLV